MLPLATRGHQKCWRLVTLLGAQGLRVFRKEPADLIHLDGSVQDATVMAAWGSATKGKGRRGMATTEKESQLSGSAQVLGRLTVEWVWCQ